MAESQNHGLKFEQNILLTKMPEIVELVNDDIGYTNTWDFPPISIKSFKNDKENPFIEMGSMFRTLSNKVGYILVLVGYQQKENKKEVTFSDAIYINEKVVKELKGNVIHENINDIEGMLKSFPEGQHEEARKWAKEIKNKNNHQSCYDMRFKIDSKKQRRLQCAINLKEVYDKLNIELELEVNRLNLDNLDSSKRERLTKKRKSKFTQPSLF